MFEIIQFREETSEYAQMQCVANLFKRWFKFVGFFKTW